MPMNREHAYGDSPIYARPSGWAAWAYALLSPFHPKLYARARVAMAWRQFSRAATTARTVRLGGNAWCINGLHDAKRITLEEHVICRGLLRVEYWGDGRVHLHPNVYIGDDTLISCASSITIGAYTLVAHNVHILDNNSHPTHWADRQEDWDDTRAGRRASRPVGYAPITIGEHVWIGFNSTLLKGVSIGDKSIIAAGSVVTETVPPQTLVAGNPAKVIRAL